MWGRTIPRPKLQGILWVNVGNRPWVGVLVWNDVLTVPLHQKSTHLFPSRFLTKTMILSPLPMTSRYSSKIVCTLVLIVFFMFTFSKVPVGMVVSLYSFRPPENTRTDRFHNFSTGLFSTSVSSWLTEVFLADRSILGTLLRVLVLSQSPIFTGKEGLIYRVPGFPVKDRQGGFRGRLRVHCSLRHLRPFISF